eukprot:COSAG06_NODE_1416_length_9534_cov_8.199788_7_plen_61_part_00
MAARRVLQHVRRIIESYLLYSSAGSAPFKRSDVRPCCICIPKYYKIRLYIFFNVICCQGD